mgnify:CR=1 FL=1|tara:strand:+ start:103 stop:489 length:387 start_codon:yes stop_codon:yes gene_type:complete
MTRSEQTYYNNIERIAVALETLVIQGKDQKINQFKKASNLVYGNEPTGRSEDKLHAQGRSDENYIYGGSDAKKSGARTSANSFVPDIQSDLDTRIYKESQSRTGAEFNDWHTGLTDLERESYRRVYGH